MKQKKKVSNIMLVIICTMIIGYTAANFALQYALFKTRNQSANTTYVPKMKSEIKSTTHAIKLPTTVKVQRIPTTRVGMRLVS